MTAEPQGQGFSHLAAREALMAMLNGYWTTQVLYVTAKLGLADALAEGPQHSATLAHVTATHPLALVRLLRGLVSLGVCAEVEDGHFALTSLGRYLRRDVPDSVWHRAIFWGEELWPLWGHLLRSVQTGEPATTFVHGMDFYAYYQTRPAAAGLFSQAITEATQLVAETVVAAYDFARVGTLVDVGGGHGTLLLAILQAHPTMHGIVFDQEHVIATAQQTIVTQGLAQRCTARGGDFFDAVPSGGDVYLLKSVLGDWDDTHSTTILRNCRRAAPHARLLVVEPVPPSHIEPSAVHQRKIATDLLMLVTTGGKKRTEAEWATLFREAGYDLVRTVSTASQLSILEGTPG
jgi:hypothetical protein